MSRAELPASEGPLITRAVGCLVWWPLAALAYLVIFPSEVGVGIVATGAGLLVLRLAHLTWGVATASAQSLRQAGSRRAATRSPGGATTAWS